MGFAERETHPALLDAPPCRTGTGTPRCETQLSPIYFRRTLCTGEARYDATQDLRRCARCRRLARRRPRGGRTGNGAERQHLGGMDRPPGRSYRRLTAAGRKPTVPPHPCPRNGIPCSINRSRSPYLRPRAARCRSSGSRARVIADQAALTAASFLARARRHSANRSCRWARGSVTSVAFRRLGACQGMTTCGPTRTGAGT
jgi:hypothetical protein